MSFRGGGRVYGTFAHRGAGGHDQLWYNKNPQYSQTSRRMFNEPPPSREGIMYNYTPPDPDRRQDKLSYVAAISSYLKNYESVSDPRTPPSRRAGESMVSWNERISEYNTSWYARREKRTTYNRLLIDSWYPLGSDTSRPTRRSGSTPSTPPKTPPTTTPLIPSSGIPRYKITSPTTRGSYTQSIRELSSNQVASYKSRGYKVDQVSSGMALSSAINISSTVHEQRYRFRHARRGIGGREITRVKLTTLRDNILKSHYSPRSLFAEDFNEPRLFNASRRGSIGTTGTTQASKLRIYFSRKKNKYYKLKPTTAQILIRRGWDLKLDSSLSEIPSSKPKLVNTLKLVNTKNITDQTKTQAVNADVQLMKAELRNLKAWIEEINQRTSRQLISLGEATTDRSEETQRNQKALQETSKWIESINERVSRQLVDLGEAVTTQSKIIQLQKAERIVQDVQKGGGGIFGGITSFFTQPSTIVIIVIAVILMIVIKFK